jgi:hypothetical protein
MKPIFFLSIVLLLSSCSSALKIRVDVLDREALRKFPDFRRLEAEQAYSKLKPIDFNEYKLELKKVVNVGLKALPKEGEVAAVDVRAIDTKIKATIDSTFKIIIEGLSKSFSEYERLQALDSSARYLRTKAKMESFVSQFLDLKDQIQKEVGQPIVGLDEFYQQKRRQVGIREEQLLDDILTSSVVHSPYKFWRRVKVTKDFSDTKYKGTQLKQKSAYSRTVVRTVLGNSDIAITMENKGHFTVKGVRLDAAKVAEATFKGLTQSIHFLAMTTNAPFEKSDSEVTVLPELEKLAKLKTKSEASQKQFDEAALELAAVALRQQPDLVGANAEKKKAAIAVLKSEFTTIKNQFSTTKP